MLLEYFPCCCLTTHARYTLHICIFPLALYVQLVWVFVFFLKFNVYILITSCVSREVVCSPDPGFQTTEYFCFMRHTTEEMILHRSLT